MTFAITLNRKYLSILKNDRDSLTKLRSATLYLSEQLLKAFILFKNCFNQRDSTGHWIDSFLSTDATLFAVIILVHIFCCNYYCYCCCHSPSNLCHPQQIESHNFHAFIWDAALNRLGNGRMAESNAKWRVQCKLVHVA